MLNVVSFGCDETDPVMAIYDDDSLLFYGDEYHDRISARITGFVSGYAFSRSEQVMNISQFFTVPASVCEDVMDGDTPPKRFDDIIGIRSPDQVTHIRRLTISLYKG